MRCPYFLLPGALHTGLLLLAAGTAGAAAPAKPAPIRAPVPWGEARQGEPSPSAAVDIQLGAGQGGDYGLWVHLRTRGGVPPRVLISVDGAAALAVIPRSQGEPEWAAAFDLAKQERTRVHLEPGRHTLRIWAPAVEEKRQQIRPLLSAAWFGPKYAATKVEAALGTSDTAAPSLQIDEVLLTSSPEYDPGWIEARERLARMSGLEGAASHATRLGAASALLRQVPPSPSSLEKRLPILEQLDEALRAPFAWQDPQVVAYYRAAVDRVLDEAEREPAPEGVRIWKLYSSAFLIRTPKTVFGIDLDQGPNQESARMTAAQEGVRLSMTPQQQERLARLVSYSFHTHNHHDHIDYELLRRMLAAGKSAIVTEGSRRILQGMDSGGTILAPAETGAEPIRLGPLAVYVCNDYQYAGGSSKEACNAYLIVTDTGQSILARGDINRADHLQPWLKAWQDRGGKLGLDVSPAWNWSTPHVSLLQTPELSPVVVPSHEYEYTHSPGLDWSFACYAPGSMQLGRLAEGRSVVLSWGESFIPRR